MRMKMSLRYIFRGGRNWNYSYRMMSSSSTTTTVMKSSPWLMLPSHSECEYDDTTKLYSLAEKKVVSIKKEVPPPAWAQGGLVKHMGCTQGWMASFNVENRQTFLSNPITGRHIKLPDIGNNYNRPSNIILTSSPDAHDCSAIITYNLSCRIAICFPAHKNPTWLPACNLGSYEPKEIVYSTRQKRLFCFTTDGKFECWDLESPSLAWKAPSWLLFDKDEDAYHLNFAGYYYLVMDDHSGRLFVVHRKVMKHVRRDGSYVRPVRGYNYPHKTLSFDVFEIDGIKGAARYMKDSLDGLAMFVGGNHSFTLPAADVNLTPDSIYFVEDYCEIHAVCQSMEGGPDIGIFNYVDTKISSIYYPSQFSQICRRIAPAFWFTPMD